MSDLVPKDFNNLIKKFRLRAGLTQGELTEKLNISIRTYQRIEMGEVYPSVDLLANLSHVLNFKLCEVFCYDQYYEAANKNLDGNSQRLEKILNLADVGGWIYLADQDSLYWTVETKKIYEVDTEFIPDFNKTFDFFKAGESRDKFKKVMQNAVQLGSSFEVELDMISAKNNEVRVAIRGSADFFKGKCLRVYGCIKNISEEQKKIISLNEKLDKLNQIQSFAGFGHWELNLEKNHLHWSETLFNIFELDPKSFEASYDSFLDLVHPDDRDKVNTAYTESLATKQPYEVEHRLLLKDGRIKWIHERCWSVFSDEGKPLISIGYAQDITRYKSNQLQ